MSTRPKALVAGSKAAPSTPPVPVYVFIVDSLIK